MELNINNLHVFITLIINRIILRNKPVYIYEHLLGIWAYQDNSDGSSALTGISHFLSQA